MINGLPKGINKRRKLLWIDVLMTDFRNCCIFFVFSLQPVELEEKSCKIGFRRSLKLVSTNFIATSTLDCWITFSHNSHQKIALASYCVCKISARRELPGPLKRFRRSTVVQFCTFLKRERPWQFLKLCIQIKLSKIFHSRGAITTLRLFQESPRLSELVHYEPGKQFVFTLTQCSLMCYSLDAWCLM